MRATHFAPKKRMNSLSFPSLCALPASSDTTQVLFWLPHLAQFFDRVASSPEDYGISSQDWAALQKLSFAPSARWRPLFGAAGSAAAAAALSGDDTNQLQDLLKRHHTDNDFWGKFGMTVQYRKAGGKSKEWYTFCNCSSSITTARCR